MHLHYLIGFLFILFFAFGCKHTQKKLPIDTGKHPKDLADTLGVFVSDGYEQRDEGYDWVKIIVTNVDSEVINISIRSRDDLKKPTCTFDGTFHKIKDSTYRAKLRGHHILVRISEKDLSIEPENKEGENVLYYYCSGGASLRGVYKKL